MSCFSVRAFTFAFASAIVVGLALNTVVHAAPPYYERILLEKHIQPTASGLKRYFKGLHPGEQQRRRAVFLIEQLGNAGSFRAREAAMAQLLVMPVLPVEALTKASQSKDPEARWRAGRILQIGRPESERVLHAACQIIRQKKIKGLIPDLQPLAENGVVDGVITGYRDRPDFP